MAAKYCLPVSVMEVIFPRRKALCGFLPEGRQEFVLHQPPQQRIDGAFLGGQDGPALQLVDDLIAVAGLLADHQQDAEFQGPPLNL